MQLSISSPGTNLKPDDVEHIERDLEKIDRRFRSPDDAFARLRVTNGNPKLGYDVLLEVDYHKYHFLAKANNTDMGMAVREAREEVIRQITDAGRGGHTAMAKGT